VSATVVRDMAKKRGRPPKPAGETEPVKLAGDLMEKIRWIVRIAKLKGDSGYTANELIEPMLRPQIDAKYKLIEADVARIKKAEESVASKGEE
jgi:hypothetical protein